MKEIQLIENRSEIGAGTRGASLGIDALKIASINSASSYFSERSPLLVRDRNDLLFAENPTPRAIHIRGIVDVFESIAELVESTLKESKFPLVLAADHASAGGTIAGIKKAFPNKRLGVVWIDAHADLHSPYTTPSGNVHGMPLATALSEDNQESLLSTPNQEEVEQWEKLKNLGGIAPKISSDDLIFFGVRDTEEPEEAVIKRKEIKNYTVEECRKEGLEKVCLNTIEQLKDCDLIYISFDVDSMDPQMVSFGTGTPVQNGFSPEEAQEIIERIIVGSKKVMAFEMVEINPLLDNKGNAMADTAFKLLEKTSQLISEHAL